MRAAIAQVRKTIRSPVGEVITGQYDNVFRPAVRDVAPADRPMAATEREEQPAEADEPDNALQAAPPYAVPPVRPEPRQVIEQLAAA